MADVNKMLYEHKAATQSMTRLLINLKKVGKKNLTSPILQARLGSLNATWAEVKALDAQLHTLVTPEFLATEAIYWEVCDYISVALDALNPQVPIKAINSTNQSFQEGTPNNTPLLGRIELKKFSGSYTDWVSFRDMFQSLVKNNDSYADVQKLYYLQLSVTGEASSLLKTIGLTDANFNVAWKKLTDRYDNSRHLIDSYLSKLFDVGAVTTENVRDLKRLRDQTSEAISSLKNLGREVDTWDDLITFMVVRKLDPVSRREWEMKIGEKTTYATYEEIHNFLEYRIRALESCMSSSSNKYNKSKNEHAVVKSHLSTSSKICECDDTHAIHKCDQFKAKSVEERQKFAREHNLCNNCLSSGHKTQHCQSKVSCYHCKLRHHSLLHNSNFQKKGKGDKLAFTPNRGQSTKTSTPEASTPNDTQSTSRSDVTPSSSQHVTMTGKNLHACEPKLEPATVMLATAWILVTSTSGRTLKLRALLDQGSQSSFVTESIAQALRAPRTKVNAPVTGIGGIEAGKGRAIVNLTLHSCIHVNESVHCTAIVFQKLTSYVPQRSRCVTSWRHLEGIQLADPEPNSNDQIQLVLGADIYAKILREGLKRGPTGSPIAQNSTFGWILSGPTTGEGSTNATTTLTAHIRQDNSSLLHELRRFWEIEEVPTCSPLTEEEQICETHFAATYKRVEQGRYCVRLPFKGTTPIKIGWSNFTAESWLTKLDRKFAQNPALADSYCHFTNEYILLNHMVPTEFNAPESTPAVYLPHHPIIKDSSSTKLRVVFNASSKTSNGTSLNDHLMVGPKLQSDLPSTVLASTSICQLTADITKMYRQILVDPEDTKYQQILWRPTRDSPITPYKLVTVTYGTAPAPFLAMRVLRQLADDEYADFPAAAAIVRDNFYVDDVLFGANDQYSANSLRQELEQLLSRGGFELRKWMSSHTTLLVDIPASDQEPTRLRSFDSTESI